MRWYILQPFYGVQFLYIVNALISTRFHLTTKLISRCRFQATRWLHPTFFQVSRAPRPMPERKCGIFFAICLTVISSIAWYPFKEEVWKSRVDWSTALPRRVNTDNHVCEQMGYREPIFSEKDHWNECIWNLTSYRKVRHFILCVSMGPQTP